MEAPSEALNRSGLYPPVEPHARGHLDVTGGHRIYFEVSGNPDGVPVVFVHGGPGGATSPGQRRFFDPDHYRIILFDQRGCGLSTPHAGLTDNTTWDLVEDMERLRACLEIDQWLVFGGSWGSTLALLYAEVYPTHVTGLVLRGIFLVRQKDMDWFYSEGASELFPEAYAEFLAPIPEDERDDLLGAYYRRLTDPNETVQLAAARAWSRWESRTVALENLAGSTGMGGSDSYAIALARIECHYFVNRGFLETDNQILENAHRITHIPTSIIHGRYDVICPARSALDLKAALPHADLEIIPAAGHSAFEPGVRRALVAATNRMRDL